MKLIQLLTLGIAIAAAVSTASPTLAQKKAAESIKVFIFTGVNDGGIVDEDQKQRLASVGDLKKALDKKDLIQLVTDEQASDVTLEVLNRGYESTGSYDPVQGSTAPTVHIRLRAGNYTAVFDGQGNAVQLGHWQVAMREASGKILKWIKENHDTLIAHRAN